MDQRVGGGTSCLEEGRGERESVCNGRTPVSGHVLKDDRSGIGGSCMCGLLGISLWLTSVRARWLRR